MVHAHRRELFREGQQGQIVDALREMKGAEAPAWNRMKKADLAALAERETAGTGWLPEPLRDPARKTQTTS